jgi:hypothetical protein
MLTTQDVRGVTSGLEERGRSMGSSRERVVIMQSIPERDRSLPLSPRLIVPMSTNAVDPGLISSSSERIMETPQLQCAQQLRQL